MANMDALEQVRVLLLEAVSVLDGASDSTTTMSVGVEEFARVEKVGKMAHLHLEQMEESDSPMTLGESRLLRKKHLDGPISSTANLFGTKGSGAILHRDKEFGSRPRDTDPIYLTQEGLRLAKLYRKLHGHTPS